VELNEAVHRILGQHWNIVLCLALLGAGLATLVASREPRTYTAATRVVLDTPDPKSQAESGVIADTARAIASSPAHVRAALSKARARDRDADALAREGLNVRSLGASGVLQLSVTDSDPATAAAIANALAGDLIETRRGVTRGQIEAALTSLDKRIDALNRQLAEATTQTAEAARERDFLAQQRAVTEAERVNLLATVATRPRPSVISPARAPEDADPSGLGPDLVLGALVGILLGVGLTALLESLRPTLVGGDAVARELDAPLLGPLTSSVGLDAADEAAASVATRIRMAAEAARVRSVTLVAADSRIDLAAVAERLRNAAIEEPAMPAVATAGQTAGPERMTRAARLPIRPFGVGGPALSTGGQSGLVVVAPVPVKKSQLDDAAHLLRVSSAPLLGLITCPPRGSWWRTRRADRRSET
jgi:capsular polysaccharide biosynthesis protein